MRLHLALALFLVTTGCIKPTPLTLFAVQTPEFRPEVFFAGKATGRGVIQTPDGKPAQIIHVESRGQTQADGSFRLDQTIRTTKQDGTIKISERHWVMERSAPNRYSATLSDAAGPVSAEVHGNLFRIRYRFKKPFVMMEQHLYLQPDGRTVLNEGRISMPGRTIARLSEIIVRESE